MRLKHYSVFHHSDHEFIHDDSDNVFELPGSTYRWLRDADHTGLQHRCK